MQHLVGLSHPEVPAVQLISLEEAHMLRKLLPLVALVFAAACTADTITGPSTQSPPQARQGSGMLGGGG